MSRPLSELEMVLQQMVIEHRKLLGHVEAHQAAMKSFALEAMDSSARMQEGCRLRITSLEVKRRHLVEQIVREAGRAANLTGNVTLAQLAGLHPTRATALLKLRDELKVAAQAVADRNYVAGRVAGAVLGHLNTVVRLLAGAVEKAGLYTRSGIPRVSARIGVMEAVG